MLITLLKSKILRATITDTNRDYEGSLVVDSWLMEQVGLIPYEKILVGNITNGKRFETYTIPAPAHSGRISLNGAAALLGEINNLLVIMSFANFTEEESKVWKPKSITLAGDNKTIIKKIPS